jgi:hypothetical protein
MVLGKLRVMHGSTYLQTPSIEVPYHPDMGLRFTVQSSASYNYDEMIKEQMTFQHLKWIILGCLQSHFTSMICSSRSLTPDDVIKTGAPTFIHHYALSSHDHTLLQNIKPYSQQ